MNSAYLHVRRVAMGWRRSPEPERWARRMAEAAVGEAFGCILTYTTNSQGDMRMADDMFEYDVFISFAAADERLVRPVWQELSLAGVRVFWSDAVLRDRVGASWFDIIQSSLSRSRHLLLVCTNASLTSEWVKREYVAFYNHCYSASSRRLVPLLHGDCSITDLPLFLRELEACRANDPDTMKRLVRLFGGVDVESLRRELGASKQEIAVLREEVQKLNQQLSEVADQTASPSNAVRSERLKDTVAKVYLSRTWSLALTPGGREMEPQYLVGTEFEYAGHDEKGFVSVKLDTGELRWLPNHAVVSEDRRAYFKIKERGVVGYLIGHMTDQGLDGSIDSIVVHDQLLGKSHVSTRAIKTIRVTRKDEKSPGLLNVEMVDGSSYYGASTENNHWGTYLIAGRSRILLDSARDITLEAIGRV